MSDFKYLNPAKCHIIICLRICLRMPTDAYGSPAFYTPTGKSPERGALESESSDHLVAIAIHSHLSQFGVFHDPLTYFA